MLTINLSELILTIFNFFLLFFLLKRFLYTPLVSFMEARRAGMEEKLEQERAALAAVREKELFAEKQRRQSMDEAKRILDDAKAAGEQRHKHLLEQAREQAVQDRKKAEEVAAEQNEKEKRQLEQHRDRLALVLAESLLQTGDLG